MAYKKPVPEAIAESEEEPEVKPNEKGELPVLERVTLGEDTIDALLRDGKTLRSAPTETNWYRTETDDEIAGVPRNVMVLRDALMRCFQLEIHGQSLRPPSISEIADYLAGHQGHYSSRYQFMLRVVSLYPEERDLLHKVLPQPVYRLLSHYHPNLFPWMILEEREGRPLNGQKRGKNASKTDYRAKT